MTLALKQTRLVAAAEDEGQQKKRYTGFQKLCLVYLFAVFALPQYFGIPVPGFALTAQRIMLICLFVAILVDKRRRDAFFVSNTGPMGGPVAVASLFIFVSLATAILRCDPKSFLNFFVDAFLPMLLMVYIAVNVLTLKELLKFFKAVLIVVCVTCYLDALVLHQNPYDFIHTIASVKGGSGWRASSYRVAAMTSHPIGLGMYFIMLTPLLCIDVDKRKVNIAKNWGTLLLVCGAVLLTGSRMPQATFVLELVVLFLFTEKSVKRVLIPYLLVFGTIAVFLVVLFHDENHIRRYVILNLYQVIDSIFGTTFVLDEFGYWQWAIINNSSNYRELLPLLLFSGDYDPLLGLGVGTSDVQSFTAVAEGQTVTSIDNFYVLQYLRFAWPGLIAILLMFAYMLACCISGAKKNIVCRMLLISFALYFINLWFVADLGTFKYAFSLFGLTYAYSKGRGRSQLETEIGHGEGAPANAAVPRATASQPLVRGSRKGLRDA